MMQMIEQADEGDRHHLGSADDRRQFAFAVGDRGAFVRAGKLAFAGLRVLSAEIWQPGACQSRAWQPTAWLAKAWSE